MTETPPTPPEEPDVIPPEEPDVITPEEPDAIKTTGFDELPGPIVNGPKPERFPRIMRIVRRIPHPDVHTRRGLILSLVLVGLFAAVSSVGAYWSIGFSETRSFCRNCHTMTPQVKAHTLGIHADVACGECHIAPGARGFIHAKIGGTKEMYHYFTSTYSKPIRANLAGFPSVEVTCMKCHPKDQITKNDRRLQLAMRPTYLKDEQNTRQLVAVAINANGVVPVAGEPAKDDQGPHSHIGKDIRYTVSGEDNQKIGLIEEKMPDGSTRQFIQASQVGVSGNVTEDIARLKKKQTELTMDCRTCHNRVGHETPNTDTIVDEAIASGKLSNDLPYIKKFSSKLLSGTYKSYGAANKSFDTLRSTYSSRYPLVLAKDGAEVNKAIDELKLQYSIVGTPAMNVQANTYPNNLGHRASPGCARCHDGSHFLVQGTKVMNKPIAWACTTCHTFPQAGAVVNELPLGEKPADHADKLWVFTHKNSVSSTQPSGTSCASCHSPSYCKNCHQSGAIKVSHDEMKFTHPKAIRKSGIQACTYCHQTSFCTTCHSEFSLAGGFESDRSGVLIPRAPVSAASVPAHYGILGPINLLMARGLTYSGYSRPGTIATSGPPLPQRH